LDGGVVSGDERVDSGAVQEGNPGKVNAQDGGRPTAQHAEQPLA
jgi:hypothetical protein